MADEFVFAREWGSVKGSRLSSLENIHHTDHRRQTTPASWLYTGAADAVHPIHQDATRIPPDPKYAT